MSRVLSLDAGQTRCRLAVPDCEVIETAPIITDHPVLPQLAARVRQGIADFGAVDEVAIGSTGLPVDATAAELLKLLARNGISGVWLAHDSITNYLASLGIRRGVMVAAGTGVVTLAVGARDLARVDGWGYLIGDAGSGYWIGRAGLDAVMRAFDGRGSATALTQVVVADFPDLPNLYLSLQNDQGRVARIASYARAITDLAVSDEICRQICLAAGRELATSALAGLKQAGLSHATAIPVGLNGRLFGAAIVRDSFCASVREWYPDAEFIDSHASSLTGVGLLPSVPAEMPLAQQIDSATLIQ